MSAIGAHSSCHPCAAAHSSHASHIIARLRLAQIKTGRQDLFTGHTAIPRENEIDFLTEAEAEAAFTLPRPNKTASKKTKTPTPIKTAQKTAMKKKTAKKEVAA
jgi:hypothetical protein